VPIVKELVVLSRNWGDVTSWRDVWY